MRQLMRFQLRSMCCSHLPIMRDQVREKTAKFVMGSASGSQSTIRSARGCTCFRISSLILQEKHDFPHTIRGPACPRPHVRWAPACYCRAASTLHGTAPGDRQFLTHGATSFLPLAHRIAQGGCRSIRRRMQLCDQLSSRLSCSRQVSFLSALPRVTLSMYIMRKSLGFWLNIKMQ